MYLFLFGYLQKKRKCHRLLLRISSFVEFSTKFKYTTAIDKMQEVFSFPANLFFSKWQKKSLPEGRDF